MAFWMYRTKLWKQKRVHQLSNHPLCAYCLKDGLVVAATVVHHVVPHKGDWMTFSTSLLESLCDHCHNSIAQSEEKSGRRVTIGLDGYPIEDVPEK